MSPDSHTDFSGTMLQDAFGDQSQRHANQSFQWYLCTRVPRTTHASVVYIRTPSTKLAPRQTPIQNNDLTVYYDQNRSLSVVRTTSRVCLRLLRCQTLMDVLPASLTSAPPPRPPPPLTRRGRSVGRCQQRAGGDELDKNGRESQRLQAANCCMF